MSKLTAIYLCRRCGVHITRDFPDDMELLLGQITTHTCDPFAMDRLLRPAPGKQAIGMCDLVGADEEII